MLVTITYLQYSVNGFGSGSSGQSLLGYAALPLLRPGEGRGPFPVNWGGGLRRDDGVGESHSFQAIVPRSGIFSVVFFMSQ